MSRSSACCCGEVVACRSCGGSGRCDDRTACDPCGGSGRCDAVCVVHSHVRENGPRFDRFKKLAGLAADRAMDAAEKRLADSAVRPNGLRAKREECLCGVEVIDCEVCEGSGRVRAFAKASRMGEPRDPPFSSPFKKCSDCSGKGVIEDPECPLHGDTAMAVDFQMRRRRRNPGKKVAKKVAKKASKKASKKVAKKPGKKALARRAAAPAEREPPRPPTAPAKDVVSEGSVILGYRDAKGHIHASRRVGYTLVKTSKGPIIKIMGLSVPALDVMKATRREELPLSKGYYLGPRELEDLQQQLAKVWAVAMPSKARKGHPSLTDPAGWERSVAIVEKQTGKPSSEFSGFLWGRVMKIYAGRKDSKVKSHRARRLCIMPGSTKRPKMADCERAMLFRNLDEVQRVVARLPEGFYKVFEVFVDESASPPCVVEVGKAKAIETGTF